mmetsp:Transcript_8686/g.23607  ORF Transcript_8686/g.23607 Transcript_8686/m.23607 type:complete len:278 (+) Transcript_8686:691-1524(+)
MRPGHGPKNIVRRLDVRHPIADGLRGGILQRGGAGMDRAHLRSQQTHPEHVQRLPFHILGTHINDALQSLPRTDRGRRHAVLTGTRLGDDPLLAHALAEKRLPQRVVDLMRPRVVQILSLEVDLRPCPIRTPIVLGQVLGVVQRTRAAHVVAQHRVQLRLERLVGHRLCVCLLEILERGNERLRHVLAAVDAPEAPVHVRTLEFFHRRGVHFTRRHSHGGAPHRCVNLPACTHPGNERRLQRQKTGHVGKCVALDGPLFLRGAVFLRDCPVRASYYG